MSVSSALSGGSDVHCYTDRLSNIMSELDPDLWLVLFPVITIVFAVLFRTYYKFYPDAPRREKLAAWVLLLFWAPLITCGMLGLLAILLSPLVQFLLL